MRSGHVSDRYEQVQVESRAQWREWLAKHHADSPGVWVVTYKKAAGERYVPYEDVVREALCFGWVDGRELEAQGLMELAGRAAVEAAKADGSWTALAAVEDLVEPDELRAALDANSDARREWDAFPRSARRGILEWIVTAKKPDTRAKRIEETARLAARGIRANQWPRPR
jgi:uncharacterized protein YdeI (YjbR/CyaY-like superfamily)